MARTNTRAPELNVYTALVVVTALVLLGGVLLLSMKNMEQAEAGGVPGSPLNLVK
ncbi:MAG: hypothetical protein LW636_05480 [Planctomycetaceae bacterium]|jgi:hypothetical protein|nr:hypothetical protein [Planctomycetaceae bacterium]